MYIMTKLYYGWFSQHMYNYTKTLYVYTNSKGDTIKSTIISTSNTTPMINIENSIYSDFICLGEVNKYNKTIHGTLQKKIIYPKPLSY